MEELVTKASTQSSACWQVMEEMARHHIQKWLQGQLEDEVTEFLGRARYRRREEGERGYRNGYGKPRRLTTRAGTDTVRRPRVRGLEGTLRERAAAAVRAAHAGSQRRAAAARVGAARAVRTGSAAVGEHGGTGEGALAPGGGRVARVQPGGPGGDVPVGRRGVRQSGAGEDKAALLGGLGRPAQGAHHAAQWVRGVDRELEGTAEGCRQRGLRCPRLVIGDGRLGICCGAPGGVPGRG